MSWMDDAANAPNRAELERAWKQGQALGQFTDRDAQWFQVFVRRFDNVDVVAMNVAINELGARRDASA